jgi:alkylation response protein AidB-like acyl-CoA dehydrogenase
MKIWDFSPPWRRTPVVRDQLLRTWIDAEVLRLTLERAEQARARGTPGPEGSIAKLASSLVGQRLAEFCLQLRGSESMLIDHYDMVQPGSFTHTIGSGGDLTKVFLAAQAVTIAGGTTNINKNIIADRILGLPPEPRRAE